MSILIRVSKLLVFKSVYVCKHYCIHTHSAQDHEDQRVELLSTNTAGIVCQELSPSGSSTVLAVFRERASL